jgi:hypothetical protein
MKATRTHLVSLIALAAVVASAPGLANHPSVSPFYGSPVHGSAKSLDRSIAIDSSTRWVNVTGGETIQFRVGGESFLWHFDTYNYSPVFDLREIAPGGSIDRPIKVYVSPHPSDIS